MRREVICGMRTVGHHMPLSRWLESAANACATGCLRQAVANAINNYPFPDGFK